MTLSFVYPVSRHNNGNLMSMSATGAQAIPGRTYTYDSLNRLITMSASGDPSGCTGLSWTYDAWGNRSAQTVTGGSCPDAFNTTFTQNNNRVDGHTYDAAGNLLNDGTHAYTNDAESRILKVDTGTTATYVYDAEGRRIEKIKGSAQTHYWYGNNGQVLGEWSQAGSIQNDYLYLGSQMLAQYTPTTTYFAHLDHLGSTRLLTSVSGATLECDDYLPFGEQLSYSGTHPCSNTADTTHKFTGQERDTESNLDKFEARYYSSTMGRFMIPDWDAKPVTVPYAHFGNPQSLNLYVYVSNNPLTFADPDGHETADEKPHEAAGAGCGVDMECESKAGPTSAAGQTGLAGPQEKKLGQYDASKTGPEDPTNPRHPLLENPLVKPASDEAWNKTQHGKAREGLAEAGFAIDYDNGKISIVNKVDSVNSDKKANSLAIKEDEHTIAILHTHGNNGIAPPSPGDMKTRVPNFVRSLWETDVTVPGKNTYIQLLPAPKK